MLLFKWTLLLFSFVLLTDGQRNFPWNESDIKKFVKESVDEFKMKLQEKWEQMNTNYASVKKRQSSKTEHHLKNCVEVLESHLTNIQQKTEAISSKVKNVWLTSSSKKIPVFKVNGRIFSRDRNTISKLQLDFKISAPSPVSLKEMTRKTKNRVKLIQKDLETTLSKSKYQSIKSRFIFLKNVTMFGAEIDKLSSHVTINRLPTSRLSSILRRKGNQVIENKVSVKNLSSVKSTVDFINKKKIEDFVLLNPGNLNLTGSYEFRNASASTIFVKGAINGQRIDDFVLTSKEQNIRDMKEFRGLSVKYLEAKSLGEIHLDFIRKAKEDSLIYPLALKFSSNLIIQGNLNITSLNDNDVLQLFSKTVKTNEEQDIKGKIRFNSVNITGNVTSSGKINSCTLNQFLTTNTNQKIYADVKFPNTVAFQNILTDSVNGTDLSEESVIRSRNSVIKGRKSFAKNLKVSRISLKEGISIDSFDPSMEDVKIVKKDDVESWSIFPFGSVNIRNINATDIDVDVNYFPQLEELDNVWLRSTEQLITSAIQTKNMRVKEELAISRVNNLTMNDLLTVKGNVTVEAPVRFFGEIFTKTLNLGKNSNVNFNPEYWNQQKVKLSNNITIEKAVLRENLTVGGSLRNFETGFMHVKDNQTINGLVQFEQIEAQNLSFKHLNFNIMNANINIADFLDRAIVAPIENKSIYNKHFKVLNGSAMTWSEVLNNVSLEKIVLKNKNQSILSSWTFKKAPSFQKFRVNNFFGDVKLKNIIYTDKIAAFANKQFNGNVTSKYLNASGRLNGVNISSLHLEAFNKSKENKLTSKLIFKGNVTADKMKVAANKIDNVNLEDTIRLNASTEFKSLNASNIIAPNIKVAGRINGCDIESVVKNAFTLRESKNITARTVIKSFEIEGNVKIKYMMGENFSDWISYLREISSAEIGRDIEFESLKASCLKFLHTLNNVTLDFLLDDAVKKNGNQNITGWKSFQAVNASKSLILTLNSDKVGGIIANELFDSCINKTENRAFTLLNPSIKSLTAKQINVAGTLNGLKLPNDVVLSNVSETIQSNVIMNNTINALLGLTIYGKINASNTPEINLENFLRRRVTLNTTQDISSSLDFSEDIFLRGNTGLNGTINNIRLENALKKQTNQTIFGLKSFKNALDISADVTINGSVNGVQLEQFVWSSRNETVKEVQFLSKINATDLICDTINGVDVSGLYNYTHITVHEVNDSLDNLTSDILSLQDSLRNQKDILEHPFSLFSYFELHEIIKSGPVLKFLPVYEYGIIGEKHELQVTQMVIWVSKKVKGCRKVESLIANFAAGDTLEVTKKMRGKLFPFSLQIENDGLVGFHVLAEEARKCSPAIRSLLIKAEFSFDDYNPINTSDISLPKGADLADVQLLELHTGVFLVVAFNMKDSGERIFTYHYDVLNNSWSEHQQFHEQNLTSMEFILVERDEMSLFDPPDVYLSVTGDKKNPGVMVYEWDYDVQEFSLKSNLSATASTHALWLYAHRNLYLILAKEKMEVVRNHTKVDVFNEPLEVYVLEEDELVLNHIVNIKGISFIESFSLAGEIYLLATNPHMEAVYILQFRGYNGFDVVQEIQAAGVTEARVYTVGSQLYLALNSRTIHSRILKARIHGGRLFIP